MAMIDRRTTKDKLKEIASKSISSARFKLGVSGRKAKETVKTQAPIVKEAVKSAAKSAFLAGIAAIKADIASRTAKPRRRKTRKPKTRKARRGC